MTTAELLPDGRFGARPPLQPWVESPYRLVSLLEMLEFNALHFQQLLNLLTALECHLPSISGAGEEVLQEGADLSPSQTVALKTADRLLSNLDEITFHLEAIGLKFTAALVERIKSHQANGTLTVENLYRNLTDLRLRLSDELKINLFFYVPPQDAEFYRSGVALFGTDVEAKFSNALYDIEEAGKCLALHRSTAAVFHLMRVMELGVQALAAKVSPNIKVNKEWGKILGDIDAEIKAQGKAGVNVDYLRNLSASLHAVKDAWRNPTMHPRDTHTEDEARRIFNTSKGFMQSLAQIV